MPGSRKGREWADGTPGENEASFAGQRRSMVQKQLSAPAYPITDWRVLDAMSKIPRHRFVPDGLRSRAYENCALPLGHGQTISQPFVVAFMTQQLELKPTDRVLEIGTGSGYQAAVLAQLAGEIYTTEIVAALAQTARANFEQLAYTNIRTRVGDGCLGWPEAAPFNAIMVTCAPARVPQPLADQLMEGGRMIIPIGPDWNQQLILLRREGDRLTERPVLPVRFVPMTGQVESGAG